MVKSVIRIYYKHRITLHVGVEIPVDWFLFYRFSCVYFHIIDFIMGLVKIILDKFCIRLKYL